MAYQIIQYRPYLKISYIIVIVALNIVIGSSKDHWIAQIKLYILIKFVLENTYSQFNTLLKQIRN